MRRRANFRRWQTWAGIAAALVLIVLAGLYAVAGFFDRDPTHLFGSKTADPEIAAVYFSGDMGIRFGMGPYVAKALAGRGVPVLGISSPTMFGTHRSRAEVDGVVAASIAETLERTGAHRIIVLGQSYGSDIARVGLVNLPTALRARVAAIVLVVPGDTAFFRADPTGLAYRGTPDATATDAPRLDWAPLTCIRGALETDSLCPSLTKPNVRNIVLPGGHFLRNDHDTLVTTIFRALGPLLPPAATAQR